MPASKLDQATALISVAGTYIDDLAYLAAADRLEAAAKLLREAGNQSYKTAKEITDAKSE